MRGDLRERKSLVAAEFCNRQAGGLKEELRSVQGWRHNLVMNYVAPQPEQQESSLRATICGSFRRDPEALRREHRELREAGCTVLSPLELEFTAEVDGFVFSNADRGKTTAEIEASHLRAMEKADLVWLHCPGGYVGTSAAMELGFAQAVGIRVFSAERPQDVTLADLVHICSSPRAAVEIVQDDLGDAPAHALTGLQSYYARIAERRGWAGETAEQTLELLKGEVAELEEELATAPDREAILLEMADVQLYLVHLANILGADLGSAVRNKERINTARFGRSPERLAA